MRALMLIQTPDMMRLFLDDLLMDSEIDLFTRRLQAADMLYIGTPYRYVRDSMGLSSKIIARISKQMRDKRGGYSEILEKLHPHGIRYFD